jgi:hypothetical protein
MSIALFSEPFSDGGAVDAQGGGDAGFGGAGGGRGAGGGAGLLGGGVVFGAGGGESFGGGFELGLHISHVVDSTTGVCIIGSGRCCRVNNRAEDIVIGTDWED